MGPRGPWQRDVHALVFFGGYYDIFDYLNSLATQTISMDGKTVAWRPDRGLCGWSTRA